MVERTEIRSEVIDLELSDVTAATRDLPKIEKRWHEEEDYGKIVYGQEWHNLMGALKYLERVCREGTMTPEQELRYQELKALLEESVPVLKRLGFTLPPVLLDG